MSRPTSFAQESAQYKMQVTEDMAALQDWYDLSIEQIDDAAKALESEQEDKSFWGNLLQYATTGGCTFATGGTMLGECVALGLIVGGGTKVGVDAAGKAEDTIPGYTAPPRTKYYAAKGDKLAKDLNKGIDDLNEFDANAWKMDLMDTMGTTMDSWKMATGMTNLGFTAENVFAEDGLFKKVGDNIGDTIDDLLDFDLDLDFKIPNLLDKGGN